MSTGLHSIGVSAGARSRRLSRGRAPLNAHPLAAQLTAAVMAVGVIVLLAQGHAAAWLAGAVAGAACAIAGTRVAAFSSAPSEPAPELAAAPELATAPELISVPVAFVPDPPAPEHDPRPPVTEPPSGEAASEDERPGRSEAELRTAEELAPLYDAGWRFVHDVAAPVGNFDHIAIGPAGVILIESRRPCGAVEIAAGAPLVTPCPDSDSSGPGTNELHNLRPRTLADAAALREELQRLAGHRVWVQAMVVFWSEFPAGCVIDGRLVFIHGSRLTRWLSRRPPQLTPAEIETVYGIVKALPGATIAEPTVATVTPLHVVS